MPMTMTNAIFCIVEGIAIKKHKVSFFLSQTNKYKTYLLIKYKLKFCEEILNPGESFMRI